MTLLASIKFSPYTLRWLSLITLPITLLMFYFAEDAGFLLGTDIVQFNVRSMTENGRKTYEEALATQNDWALILSQSFFWIMLVVAVYETYSVIRLQIDGFRGKIRK